MPKFTVNRYLLVSTEVEAENAEEALRLEEGLQIAGDLECPDALSFSWCYSDAMGEEVRDEADNIVLENW